MASDAIRIGESKKRYFLPECPFCRCRQVCRLPSRGIIENHLLRAFHLRPHQCMECDRRFYAWNVTSAGDDRPSWLRKSWLSLTRLSLSRP